MKTSQFKTNAKCNGCVAKIGAALDTLLKRDQWNIDLSTPDRILTVTSDCPDEEIIRLVTGAGFKAEKID